MHISIMKRCLRAGYNNKYKNTKTLCLIRFFQYFLSSPTTPLDKIVPIIIILFIQGPPDLL